MIFNHFPKIFFVTTTFMLFTSCVFSYNVMVTNNIDQEVLATLQVDSDQIDPSDEDTLTTISGDSAPTMAAMTDISDAYVVYAGITINGEPNAYVCEIYYEDCRKSGGSLNCNTARVVQEQGNCSAPPNWPQDNPTYWTFFNDDTDAQPKVVINSYSASESSVFKKDVLSPSKK